MEDLRGTILKGLSGHRASDRLQPAVPTLSLTILKVSGNENKADIKNTAEGARLLFWKDERCSSVWSDYN